LLRDLSGLFKNEEGKFKEEIFEEEEFEVVFVDDWSKEG
jgi:hypothetical protein